MRFGQGFSFLTLIAFGLLYGSPAQADSCTSSQNIVANCGFETGGFTSWTIGGNISNPGNNYYGIDAFDAHSGTYGAYMSQDYVDGSSAAITLNQTLATAAGDPYTITFWLEQATAPTPGYTHAFSVAWNGTTIFSLIPTVISPGVVGNYVEYSVFGVATSPFTTLQFSFENDDNYWQFDDVSVTTPEPSSLGLLCTGLCAFWFCGRLGSAIAQSTAHR